jgi:8-amino-7-oxononanoate synthase
VIPSGSRAAAWASEELEAIAAEGLVRTLESRSSPQGARVTIAGASYVNLSSNDYLGLANDPRLQEAARAELSRSGFGAGASRLLVGDTDAHRTLERTAAEWMSSEAALLFNSGYAANSGVLAVLGSSERDAIFSDALNHASIIDGCRLARAKTIIYPHRDLDALERALRSETRARRRIIVSESVFSMDGDRAPIRALVDLAGRYGAALVIDEAHAIGVLGPNGRGLSAELGVSEKVDVTIGTLGKALGSFGAFAVAHRSVIDLFLNKVRPFAFSTALPPSVCAASTRAIRILVEGDELPKRLHHNIERFRAARPPDEVTPTNEHTPIFSIVLGAPEKALAAGRHFRHRGLYAKPIRPPTVPEGTSRLRISLSAAHTDEDVDRAIAALRELDRS